MLAKVKAQKTRLSNFLTKELGASLIKSQSTESEYFQLGPISIRISDHSYRRDNDHLNILIPFNDANSFIIENNFTISILKSLKEVKVFLQSLLFVSKIGQESLNTNYGSQLIKQREEISKLNHEIEFVRLKNEELSKSIASRNLIIVELSEKVKAAENLALSNPKNVVEKRATILNAGDIIEDSIIINRKIYPLKYFDQPFKNKINNIIESTKALKIIKSSL